MLDGQGRCKGAEVMQRQVLVQNEEVLGPEHPHTLASVYSFAHLLASQCQYNESLALFQRACAGFSAVLGEDHPTTRWCRQLRSEALASQAYTLARS
jgi:hypothetical protein